MLLDPGMNLTLRPMQYPLFYDMYRDAIKNTWTVEEVDFSTDVNDLRNKMGPRKTLNQSIGCFLPREINCCKQLGVKPIQAHQLTRRSYVSFTSVV